MNIRWVCKKHSQFIVSIGIAFLSIFCSYKAAYFLGEKYFFDKLFFQKSTTYGYWRKNQNLKDFGERSRDLVSLMETDNVFRSKTSNPREYTIFAIGDSYVFGQGIRQEERFVVLLEKQLSRLRKTRVYALASSGNSILDNHLIYKKAVSVFGKPDLVIIGLVHNDLFVPGWCMMLCDDRKEILDSCNGTAISDPYYNLNTEQIRVLNAEEQTLESMEVYTKNYCIFQKLIPLLPKERAIYMNFDTIRYPTWELNKKLIRLFESEGFPVFFPSSYLRKQYPLLNAELQTTGKLKKLSVSEKDGHSSGFANRIYAEALFEEIVFNPQWGFSGRPGCCYER